MKVAQIVVREVAILGGLGAVFTGLWWERPAVAMVIVGGIIFYAGVNMRRAIAVPVDKNTSR